MWSKQELDGGTETKKSDVWWKSILGREKDPEVWVPATLKDY